MIPERTHEALKNCGIGHIGSANADLKTTHTETLGASLDNENNTVTCFVLSLLAEPILKNLREKGRVSFFFGLPDFVVVVVFGFVLVTFFVSFFAFVSFSFVRFLGMLVEVVAVVAIEFPS